MFKRAFLFALLVVLTCGQTNNKVGPNDACYQLFNKWGEISGDLKKLLTFVENESDYRKEYKEFCNTIRDYNSLARKRNFEVLENEGVSRTYIPLLPKLIKIVLQTPEIITSPTPYMRKQQNGTIFMSEKQAFMILLNGFFATFPYRDRIYEPEDLYHGPQKEFATFPDINFLDIFGKRGNPSSVEMKAEKLKCFLNYFSVMSNTINEKSQRSISYERRVLKTAPNWKDSRAPLIKVRADVNTKIEDYENGLWVDFANKYTGGGVLANGATMEEVMYVTHPELVVSRLFSESLDDNEVLIIKGHKKFNLYTGYSYTFKYAGPFSGGPTKLDNYKRLNNEVAVMDALKFTEETKQTQYEVKNVNRELSKCFIAFTANSGENSPIVTGNWGAGVFLGDRQFKFLIQLIAASEAKRSQMIFTVLSYENHKAEIDDICKFLSEKRVTVGQLYSVLISKEMKERKGTVFQLVKTKF